MSFEQLAIFGLLVCMFVVYALERFRPELVALSGLAAAFVLGLVPVQDVFAGFSNPAVVTVAEILLIVTVLARTQVVDRFAQAIVSRASGERPVLAVLCVTGASVSVFMNNIGALALMFPVALSVCDRLGVPPARMLMALSFATLLGGLCSLTGTPANLVVNAWMIEETGGGFGYFEMGLVGAPVAAAGLAWLVLAAPRVFGETRATPAASLDVGPAEFLHEAAITTKSNLVGLRLPEAERRSSIHVHGVVRSGAHVFARREDIRLTIGDILLVEAEADCIDALYAAGTLNPTAGVKLGADSERLEVVVMPDSTIVGSRVGSLEAFAGRGVAVAALGSRRRRIEGRFEDLQLGVGDVLILAGDRTALREAVAESDVLPLSMRARSRKHPKALPSLAIFGLGVASTAFSLAPPEIAFGAVVIAMAMLGSLQLRSALQDMNWSIIILLACMIPLGAAVEDTGAARVIANGIVSYLPTTEPLMVAASVLLLAVAITPFVDNVSTVAVLSPIAVGISTRAGVPIEALLIAVQIGASLDFLTPFGHHNNAVVMGAAGYRFIDFPRLGAPLVVLCVAIAAVAIGQIWI